MSVVEIISAAVAKKGLEKVVNDIYGVAKDKIRTNVKRWKAKATIDKLYTKIKHVRKVNTILQPEKAIDLLKFYYPSKVEVGKKRKQIKDIEDLACDGNIVIRGTVGQGKSIFFRYLTSREMVKGKRLPLFIELRKIEKNEKLISHLIEEAKVLGLKGVDEETFEWLAEQGKVLLVLDAFDEILESERKRLTTEIERLAKKHDQLRILISSRPSSGIENSAFFNVFDLAPFQEGEYKGAIRVMAEHSVAETIIKAVKGSQGAVRDLLTTPLMVALLVVRHRIEQTIPENVLGFYKGLFGLLISRHDRLKGGYTRQRKSKLGDTALEDVFEGMCFLAAKEPSGSLDWRKLVKYAKRAADLTGQKCNPDEVVHDIVRITCLILEEGDECKFIHKSVQEYHAASFIAEQPDQIAHKFYSHAVESWANWQQELAFLEMIDEYRFLKWFLIPDMCNWLELKQGSLPREWKTKPEDTLRVFERSAFWIEMSPARIPQFAYGPLPYIVQKRTGVFVVRPIIDSDWAEVVRLIKQKGSSLAGKARKGTLIGGRKCYRISGKHVFESGVMTKIMTSVADGALQKVYKELVKAVETVKKIEARVSAFEF